jgi:chemotaxis protein methyltransferase CheR
MTGLCLDEPALTRLADFITERTGLVFAPHRRGALERGLNAAWAAARVSSVEGLIERLAEQGTLWDTLIDEITVGETYFFREPEHFAFVKREVLPAIIGQRGRDHGVRVWSAGCASGEETYSLAILLQEQGLLARANVLGTDISALAIARARAGIYRSWSLRNAEALSLAPYLSSEDGQYRVRSTLRARVSFERLNLALPAYPSASGGTSRLDLILCRNVFIYLDAKTLRGASERLYAALAPGGYLLTGPSDPLLSSELFQLITTRAGIVYRRPRHEASLVVGGIGTPARDAAPRSSFAESGTVPVAANGGLWSPEPPSVPQTEGDEAANDQAESAASIRALASATGPAAAERACRLALERAPLSVELQYLHGLLLIELGDGPSAIAALRRTLYLDGSLAIVHFTLGSLLARGGDQLAAQRAYRNAERAASALAPDAELALAGGVSAAGLASAAQRELALMVQESEAGR